MDCSIFNEFLLIACASCQKKRSNKSSSSSSSSNHRCYICNLVLCNRQFFIYYFMNFTNVEIFVSIFIFWKNNSLYHFCINFEWLLLHLCRKKMYMENFHVLFYMLQKCKRENFICGRCELEFERKTFKKKICN